MSLTVTATIGRNVGIGAPMCPRRWEAFQRDVRDALASIGRPSFTATYVGTGEWQGVSEESAAVVATYDIDPDLSTLPTDLAALARTYGQDAIALSTAVVTFVAA